MRQVLAGLVLTLAAAVSAAPGCPICSTGTGQQVRAGIFDGNFARNAVATLLPFPFLLGTVAAIHFGWPQRRRQGRGGGRPSGEAPEHTPKED